MFTVTLSTGVKQCPLADETQCHPSLAMGRDCACNADGPGALRSSMQEARYCSLDTDSRTKVPATSCEEVLGTWHSAGTRSQVKAMGAFRGLTIVTFVQPE